VLTTLEVLRLDRLIIYHSQALMHSEKPHCKKGDWETSWNGISGFWVKATMVHGSCVCVHASKINLSSHAGTVAQLAHAT